jgi:hypothetical protein
MDYDYIVLIPDGDRLGGTRFAIGPFEGSEAATLFCLSRSRSQYQVVRLEAPSDDDIETIAELMGKD